jgi:hypothetical protein
MPDSPNVHVFFGGQTILRGATSEVIRFEDGGSDRVRIVWAPKPIDAGFFLYKLPKARWKVGERPVGLSVEDAKGNRLARNTALGRYFREAQMTHLAPPSAAGSNTSPLWSILAAAGAIIAAAGLVVWWARSRTAQANDARVRESALSGATPPCNRRTLPQAHQRPTPRRLRRL